ncbi:MAG: hypothetical protein U0V74_07655 [Chitinophagales bacterium]
MAQELNLVSALRTILKWKFHIIGLTIGAGITAALVSVFVMDEYYYSWATFYPTNQYLNDRSMIFNTESTGGQVEYFGGKTDVNRALTIANSAPVIDYIIDSFKLVDHYKIDRDKKYWKTIVTKKFEKNYKAIKTDKEAVEVSIYDTDPKVAAAIINAIVEKTDELNKKHVNESKEKLYVLMSDQIVAQQAKVTAFDDTLIALASKYNIKTSVGADGASIVQGNDFRAVQDYQTIMEQRKNTVKELNNRINIKEQMEVSLKSNSSSLFVVEGAFAADRREKPVRSLVVLITMLITAFVSILGVMLIEELQDIRKQL